MSRNRWQEQAVCAQVDPMLWTETPSGGEGTAQSKAAVKVCEGCPVWRECRLTGLGEVWHTWGGLSPRDRQRIRTEMGIWAEAGSNPTHDPIEVFRLECVEALADAGDDIEAAYQAIGCEGLLTFGSIAPVVESGAA